MHKLLSVILLCTVVTALELRAVTQPDWENLDPDDYIAGELLVGFQTKGVAAQRVSVPANIRQAVHGACGTQLKDRARFIAVDVVTCPAGAVLAEIAAEYLADPNVSYVEPNYKIFPTLVPDDFLYTNLWGMERIEAELAWDITTGSTNVNVAVVDTGVWRTHEDLTNNLWFNPGEDYLLDGTPGNNGLDDDANGFVDDYNGFSFCSFDGNPDDLNGHGTHVSGTIGAVGSNAVGVVGVSWTVKIATLQIFCSSAGFFAGTFSAIMAIEYASDPQNNIKVSNHSWGGGLPSEALNDAINEAAAKGHLLVIAAGNNGSDNDFFPFYPAAYTSDNIIAVASITEEGELSSFSNVGKETVDIAAPGSDIQSSWVGDAPTDNKQYNTISGTSMATPHVTGAAALLWSINTNLTARQVRAAILSGAKHNAALEGRVATEAELNLPGMLNPSIFVTPSTEYRTSSDPGQTNYFRPSKEYTVINGSPLADKDVIVTNTEPWILSTPSNFTLLAGTETTVVVTINADVATNLPIGIYTGYVAFAEVSTNDPPAEAILRQVLYRVATNYVLRSTEFDWIDPVADFHDALALPFGMGGPFEFPFRFSYYDEVYSNFYVVADGTLRLTLDFSIGANQDIPDGLLPDAVIAPHWDEMRSQLPGARVYSAVLGTSPSQEMVVTWHHVGHNEAVLDDWFFQMIVRENASSNDNEFVFQYLDVVEENEAVGSGRSATIGLEDQYGIMVRSYSVDGAQWLADNRAMLLSKTPPVDTISPGGQLTAVGNIGSDVRFEFRPDEIITGLDTNDIVLGGNETNTVQERILGGGLLYYIDLTNALELGTVEITIPAGSFFDLSGNSNETAIGPVVYTMPYASSDFFDDMEVDEGFWTPSGEDPTDILTRGWERGTPDPGFVRGPGVANSGTNCWGTYIGQDYSNYMHTTLTSEPLYAGDQPELNFYLFYDIEDFNSGLGTGYDDGFVEVNAGEGWHNVSVDNSYRGRSLTWRKQVVPLDNEIFGNREIRVRFRAVSDFSIVSGGMYVDDFSLVSRRPSGFWVTNVSPAAASAPSTTALDFIGYNSTTQFLTDVMASVSVPASGGSISGPADIDYGDVGAGVLVTETGAVDLSLGGVQEFDTPRIELFHIVTTSGDPLNSQFIPFQVLGVAPLTGDKRFTALASLGVVDWLGRPLTGNGSSTSALFQVIYAGSDGLADAAMADGGVTDDDRVLVTLDEDDLLARFGEGVLETHAGTFLKTFKHDRGSGAKLFVRAWENDAFLTSLAYGNSSLYTLLGDDVQTNDFEAWTVDTPTDDARDTNGDGVPDSYYIGAGMDPRASGSIGPSWAPSDGSSVLGSLSFPGRVSASDSHVYIADTRNDRILVASLSLGTIVQTFGSFGSGDGEFNWPEGLAYDSAIGRVYVADTKNDRVVVLNVSGSGQLSFNFDFDGSVGGGGRVDRPYDVGTDSLGNIYVADTHNNQVQKFNKLGDYLDSAGGFNKPSGIAVDGADRVVVADTDNHHVDVLDDGLNNITTFGSQGTGAGELQRPTGIGIGASNRIYVAEQVNSRIQIFSAAPAPVSLAMYKPPSGVVGSGSDELRLPQGVWPVRGGERHEIYVADTWNHRIKCMELILDADGDGMDDVWEDLHGLDSTVDDSLLNKDGDAVTNVGEFRFGSDPDDPTSFPFATAGDEEFFLRSVELGGGSGHASAGSRDVVFSWDAADGGIYEIQHCENIVGGAWNAGALVYSDEDGVMTVTKPVPNASRFFRIRWLNP